MPTMIKRISGLANFRVVLLVAVPYIVAVVAMQLNGWRWTAQAKGAGTRPFRS